MEYRYAICTASIKQRHRNINFHYVDILKKKTIYAFKFETIQKLIRFEIYVIIDDQNTTFNFSTTLVENMANILLK